MAGGCGDASGELRSVYQHDVASRREHVVNDVLAAHQASDMQAALPGEGDYRASDARIASILDHPITRLEVDEFAQQERSGRGIEAQQREVLRISAGCVGEKPSRRHTSLC